MNLLISFPLAALVGIIAWQRGVLTQSGAVGATLIGGLVLGFGGVTWAALLVLFFLSSSALTHYRGAEKRALAIHLQRGPRTFTQTMANGGIPALLAIGVGIVTRESAWYPTFALAYIGALSAAAADTWATELGLLSSQPPRLLFVRAETPPGRSGGVTMLGLLASLAGGAFMGIAAFVLVQAASLLTTGQWFLQDWFLPFVGTLSGFIGALVDSLLGASLQALYYCEACGVVIEEPFHVCKRGPYSLIRGYAWLDNDFVNFMATAVGALFAAGLGNLFL
ncbi:MAG: DUF92 domain-containing protein [Chloroflexi bacterium]|nr:DUF92 domain-containing protein [Chloroflexota bacterium]